MNEIYVIVKNENYEEELTKAIINDGLDPVDFEFIESHLNTKDGTIIIIVKAYPKIWIMKK